MLIVEFEKYRKHKQEIVVVKIFKYPNIRIKQTMNGMDFYTVSSDPH